MFVCAAHTFVRVFHTFVCAAHTFVRIFYTFVCAAHTFVRIFRTFVCAAHTFVRIFYTFVCAAHTFVRIFHTFVCAAKPRDFAVNRCLLLSGCSIASKDGMERRQPAVGGKPVRPERVGRARRLTRIFLTLTRQAFARRMAVDAAHAAIRIREARWTESERENAREKKPVEAA